MSAVPGILTVQQNINRGWKGSLYSSINTLCRAVSSVAEKTMYLIGVGALYTHVIHPFSTLECPRLLDVNILGDRVSLGENPLQEAGVFAGALGVCLAAKKTSLFCQSTFQKIFFLSVSVDTSGLYPDYLPVPWKRTMYSFGAKLASTCESLVMTILVAGALGVAAGVARDLFGYDEATPFDVEMFCAKDITTRGALLGCSIVVLREVREIAYSCLRQLGIEQDSRLLSHLKLSVSARTFPQLKKTEYDQMQDLKLNLDLKEPPVDYCGLRPITAVASRIGKVATLQQLRQHIQKASLKG